MRMEPDDVTVAHAMRADVARLADLINSSYRAKGKDAGWTHEVGLLAGVRTDATVLRSLIAKGEATILLMRRNSDGSPLGCISVEIREPTDCYLSLLAIDPEQQTSGYGRRLLAEAEAFARMRGARTAGMTVIRQRENLIAWYERRGYRRTGELIPFPYDDPSVGTPLREDLELVVLRKALSGPQEAQVEYASADHGR